MKRLIVALALSFSGLNTLSAQNIAYEVIRTEEAPGYFALRVYPGNDLPPLEVETVLVENFQNKSERTKFAGLISNLKNTGLKVLSAEAATELVDNDNYRLVLLGGPTQNRWLQFKPKESLNFNEQFEMFSLTKLGPVYLSNIQADFGGNVSQVRPDQVPFLDQQSTYFVGQFDKPMKTRVSLSGETPDLMVQADGIMDLTDYVPSEASSVLAQLWVDLNPSNVISSGSTIEFNIKKIVTSSFPYLLALLGLILMYISTRPSRLRTGMIDQMDEMFWRTPIEETPLYQAWEKNFPWELTDRELKLTQ
jgi:hypothetical protein